MGMGTALSNVVKRETSAFLNGAHRNAKDQISLRGLGTRWGTELFGVSDGTGELFLFFLFLWPYPQGCIRTAVHRRRRGVPPP